MPPWWTEAVLYHAYPRSFADSSEDGVGDLRGITTRLGYRRGDVSVALSLSGHSQPLSASAEVMCSTAPAHEDQRISALAPYEGVVLRA